MEILNLRVARKVAGRTFPFDRVYLVKFTDRKIIARLFRYALCMPVEGPLKKMLKDTVPEVVMTRPHERDDALSVRDNIAAAEWERKIDGTPWVMVVPILPKFVTKNLPQYIAASGWFKKVYDRGSKKRTDQYLRVNPFPNRTFLLTPEKKIRPVCVACPRLIIHQNGGCTLGDAECYEHLALGITNHFEEGMKAPEPTPNHNEAEVEAITNGNLPADDA